MVEPRKIILLVVFVINVLQTVHTTMKEYMKNTYLQSMLHIVSKTYRYGEKDFCVPATKFVNNLPVHITTSVSFFVFKSRLKT